MFFQKITRYYSTLGFAAAMLFVAGKLLRRMFIYRASVHGLKAPVYIRLGSTDLSVLKQVLIEKQYDLDIGRTPRVIIDAGANIGLSSVFFANKYPDANIFAIEPEASNFHILKRNVGAYPRIIPICAALWNTESEINLIDPGFGAHGFQVIEMRDRTGINAIVKGISIETLLREHFIDYIDILKLDIEGSEKEVFDNSANWIGKVNSVMVELHDHLKPGCHNAFLKATEAFTVASFNGEVMMRSRPPESLLKTIPLAERSL